MCGCGCMCAIATMTIIIIIVFKSVYKLYVCMGVDTHNIIKCVITLQCFLIMCDSIRMYPQGNLHKLDRAQSLNYNNIMHKWLAHPWLPIINYFSLI